MNGRYNMTYYPNKLFSPFTPLRNLNTQSVSPCSLITADNVGVLNEQRCNIETYQKYMLYSATKNNTIYAMQPVEVSCIEEIDMVPSCCIEKNTEHFQPRQSDTLFWCMYVLHHGINQYHNIGHNYGVRELEEKQRLAAFINNNKSKVKGTNYKVTNVLIQEILSELLTSQKETSLHVLIALTVFYDINIFIVDADDRCMLEFLSSKEIDESTQTYVLYKDKYGKYSAQLEWISFSQIVDMRQKYIVLDNYLRPMKAVSAYKVEELVELARKLSIYDENRKYKKSELYDAVHELCKWK
jgi:hypothetical protein